MNTKNVSSMGILVILLILTSGCATQKMYYWENYSKSLYDYKKDPSDKTLAEHKQVLLNIMQVSQQNNARVPPGVCCEYAYILIKEGRNDEAMKYLAMEEQAYPESQPFIARLKNKIEVQKK
jgi:hypothetical protein